MKRRHLPFALAGLLAGALRPTRAAGLGEVRTISVGAADLARALEQHFPLQLRVLELADARATRPRLRLLPEVNRLAIDVDLLLTERVLGAGASGRMAFDAGLRFDAADPAIRLTQPRVRSFQFDGLPPQLAASVTPIGRELAEQWLDALAVYRPRPEDLRSAELLGYRPGAITVLADAVRLTLEPL
jgi:hypothetical protein